MYFSYLGHHTITIINKSSLIGLLVRQLMRQNKILPRAYSVCWISNALHERKSFLHYYAFDHIFTPAFTLLFLTPRINLTRYCIAFRHHCIADEPTKCQKVETNPFHRTRLPILNLINIA